MRRSYKGKRFTGIQVFRSQPSENPEGKTERRDDSPNVIVYVHGIGNKPSPSSLKKQWDEALFEVDLGQRSRMAYWVNREYYPIPLPGDVPEGERLPLPEPDTLAVQIHSELAVSSHSTREAAAAGVDTAVYLEAKSLARKSAKKEAKLLAIARKIERRQLGNEPGLKSLAAGANIDQEILPTLPLRRIVTRNITRAFLRDVNDFLYHPERRQLMESRLKDRLKFGGPFVVIGHSQGSMIAYSVLSSLRREDCDVHLFLTIGSPLGIAEVQDELRDITGGYLRVPPCVRRWVNVADRLDPLAVDPTLRREYASRNGVRVEDINRLMLNPDSPRHPHSGTGYLRALEVRKVVQDTVGASFGAPVASFTVSRDVASFIEDNLPNQRINVLIELQQLEGVKELDQRRETVIEKLHRLPDFDDEKAQLEKLERFVAVKLNRAEIEQLATSCKTLNLGRIWRDSEKTSLIVHSCNTIHVRPAWQSFQASGEGIRWAVLDTGIAADHPHFHNGGKSAVEKQYDCTQWNREGNVDPIKLQNPDKNGHGTHVAAIIAGQKTINNGEADQVFSGMAPRATLVGYKVLDDAGRGRDSWIIKALQHITRTNESSASLVIHGINLSLGGSFDPTVYGCGHSPLCNELRRLWRQGVLVCIAAGNRGLTEIQTRSGFVQTNLDLTIGDPANLEETISVGSVNKSNPFTFGISYFSSRGPTADGRIKPDVVAPGEKIISANSRFTPKSSDPNDLYVELSGTSMAAPHISGMLACFLSLRREYIGYPDLVKKVLLESCAPLGRDVYSEGRGLPSLMKMLSDA